MKKLCLLLALVLALGCVPALAAQGDMILGRSEEESIYFSGCYAKGDTLYMPAYDSVYTWQVGQTELKSYSYDLKPLQKDNLGASMTMFACDGQLYGIALMSSYDEHTVFERAELYALTLEDGGTVSMEYLRELDWEDLVEYYDQDAYASAPENIVAMGNVAYMRYTNDQYDFVVGALDLETGRIEELDELADAFCIAPYGEGRLLVEQYNYNQNDVARLLVYDPESESVETLSELTIEPYSPLAGLAYDAATDTLYCVKGGEICVVDLEAGEVGEGVTDMPIEIYGNASACVLEGGYYALASEGLAIRNLDPGQRADIRFKVVDASYTNAVTKAYTDFANAHGDVSVVLSRDYSETENLIENMMNRDDSVDVYTLNTSTAIYDALYKRGYLMELEGEAVDQLKEAMYPSLRDCLSANGQLVALPLELYSNSCLGVNEKALEALGLTLEDVPDNWWDLLDFLPTLEEPLAANKSVSLYWPDVSASNMRANLFYSLFENYQSYVNVVDPAMGYDTELFRGLLDKLDAIDFVALGFAEEEEDEDSRGGMVVLDYDSQQQMLFELNTSGHIGGYGQEYAPVLLGLDAEHRAPLVLDATVAFVNPFTQHPQEALDFMNALAESLPDNVRYNLDPSLNEPVRGAQNERALEDFTKELEKAREELANAEPAEKQALEEQIASQEEYLEYLEANAWDCSPAMIKWYREHAEGVVTAPVNWLYTDESGEAWGLMQQYLEGGISADEMLKGIDRKVQMMMLEGN